MTVTGHTRVFAIIADPVHHVRTPQALNALFAARGYDGIVVPAAVPASGLKYAAAACVPSAIGAVSLSPCRTRRKCPPFATG